MKITREGLAMVVEILNRDGSVDAIGVSGDPLKDFAGMKIIAEKFMAQSRALGNMRTAEEKNFCVLISIFRTWCEERLKAKTQ